MFNEDNLELAKKQAIIIALTGLSITLVGVALNQKSKARRTEKEINYCYNVISYLVAKGDPQDVIISRILRQMK